MGKNKKKMAYNQREEEKAKKVKYEEMLKKVEEALK